MPIEIPSAPKAYTTLYSDLKGVDFSTDPALVYRKRSPSALNMISNEGGNPQKRTGWKTVCKGNGQKVTGMWSFNYSGEKQLVFQRGSQLCKFGTDTVLLDDQSDAPALGFATNKGVENNFYIIKSGKVYQFSGSAVEEIEPYIPTALISRKPVDGGGEILEGINLLTTRRIESFLGDGSHKDYYVTMPIDTARPIVVKYKNSNGEYVTAIETTDYTINAEEQKITFKAVHAPVVTGEDNVTIEYSAASSPEAAGALKACTTVAMYGTGGSDKVFLSGSTNPAYGSYVWYSVSDDPTYFPDLSYFLVGASDTSIMGLIKVGEYLGVVKESNDVDNTVWLAYPTTFDENPVYAVKQSVSGIGAVSKKCFKTLNDEPLFLSKEGICGIAATTVEVERAIKNRSYYINKRLLAEENLKEAIAVTYNGYYILCVNSHCYILDGRQKSSWKTEWTNYLYECYYWENIPATVFVVHDDLLWFGTADGRICKFKTEAEEGIDAYSDDGEAIFAEWSTPIDNDNATQLFKTLNKKGGLCTVQPFARSSVTLYLSADGAEEICLGRQYIDRFIWRRVDFGRFPFTSNTTPKDLYINKKKKKYKRLQIILRNEGVNEGFGVYEVVKTYSMGNYSKNKRGDGTWRL